MLWALLRTVGYAGAAPVTYSRDHLFAIRGSLPATPELSSDVLRQLRTHRLHVIPQTVRGSKGANRSSRNRYRNSQNGANLNNLIRIKTECSKPPSKDQVLFGLINTRSVKNKATQLNEYISDNKLDLVAVTETWLNDGDQVTLGNICPSGYKVISKPRSGRGGGVAIIYNSSLRVKEVTHKQHASFEHIEVLVQSPDNTGMSLCLVYRPPPNKKNGLKHNEFIAEISDFLDEWVLNKNRLLLCGDFNYHVDNVNDKVATEFSHLLESYGLRQHVSSPTHAKGHVLDLVFTRETDNLLNNVSVTDTQISDHFWVHGNLALHKPEPTPKEIEFRKLKDVDIEAFRKDILSSAIANPTEENDVEMLVTKYNSVLSELLDKHAPKKSIKVLVRNSAPWYNGDIKSAKRECRRAERRWRNTNLTVHKEIYGSSLKYVTDLIDKAKQSYYGSKIKSADQKSVFKLASTLLNKPKDLSLPVYDSAYDLATRFNQFFVKKIVDIRSDLVDIIDKLPKATPASPAPLTSTSDVTPPRRKPPPLHTFKPATTDEIKKIINCTKTTQCSLDPLPTKIVKECIDALLPVITKIVNLSLSQGIMPTQLKKALVIPLLKKINLIVEILKNFRPVSNLAYISKVIERIVAKRVISHMDINHLHEILQSSYKRFHSCETALIRVQNDILEAIDGKKCVLLVLLDLSAAFDTVDHRKLLELLAERIGLEGMALKWFVNYLSDRIQSVLIDGKESEPWKILFGVPQGSVLGPILFIIYTSPLGDILRRHGIMFHLYADDTQLYLSFNINECKEAFEKIELCISEIKTWMASNFLRLNDSKTEVLLIGSPHLLKKLPKSELHIGDDVITPSSNARNIGAMFDDTLSMNDHIAYMCKGAWHHLRQIGQIRNYLDSSAATTLMHSFVSSRLDNFNGLLFGVPKQHLGKLQRIQNAAARVVTRTKKGEHITPILRELHWLPVAKRVEYKILLLTYKALHGMAPSYIADLLTVSKKSRCVRSNSMLMLDIPRTKSVRYGDRAFSFSAPTLWNKLPHELKEASTTDSFKSQLKTLLFKEAYNV